MKSLISTILQRLQPQVLTTKPRAKNLSAATTGAAAAPGYAAAHGTAANAMRRLSDLEGPSVQGHDLAWADLVLGNGLQFSVQELFDY